MGLKPRKLAAPPDLGMRDDIQDIKARTEEASRRIRSGRRSRAIRAAIARRDTPKDD